MNERTITDLVEGGVDHVSVWQQTEKIRPRQTTTAG